MKFLADEYHESSKMAYVIFAQPGSDALRVAVVDFLGLVVTVSAVVGAN